MGPTLTDFGVSGVLAMPQLTVFDSGGAVITSNAGWNNDPILASAAQATGAFALDYNTFDSAVLVSLVPGAYTAQVTGTGSTTGVALLEIYEVP
ncbi:MAG: hypothetical protein ACREFX_00025 [Opitutaceae bacterium]